MSTDGAPRAKEMGLGALMGRAYRRLTAQRLPLAHRDSLRELVELGLIDPHAARQALVDVRAHDADVVHDQAGPRGQAFELLVGAQRADLLLASTDEHETVQVTAVRLEQHDLERLDPAGLLELAVPLDRFVEHVEALALTPAHRRTPTEKHA